MKGRRKGIGTKLRFEVFKRDSFTCQYCGEKAPDVVLQVDHIDPVARGGDGDILNLITSCAGCNSGKGDRILSEQGELAKQRAQLEELNERRLQLEAMIEWREGLRALTDTEIRMVAEHWESLVRPMGLTDSGRANLRKLVKRFGSGEVLEAIDIAVEQYVEFDTGAATLDSVNLAFRKLGGICFVRKHPDRVNSQDAYYVRGILRNRLSYINDAVLMPMLAEAEHLDIDMESVKQIARTCRSWSAFRSAIRDYINRFSEDDDG